MLRELIHSRHLRVSPVKNKILNPDWLLYPFIFSSIFPAQTFPSFHCASAKSLRKMFGRQRCFSAFANPFDDSDAETQNNDP